MTQRQPSGDRPASLEVVATHPSDAEQAQAGGADRVHACVMTSGEPTSPEPVELSAIVRATDLPVRVTLRLSAGFTTQGGEFTRLVGLADSYLSLGAEGCCLGFLTPDVDADAEVCAALMAELPGVPWTFDSTFDRALDPRLAWRALAGLPGLDAVHTAGSVAGTAAGYDDVVRLAEADPEFAAVAVATGDIPAEAVPWLVRAGVSRLHLGAAARPGGSWSKAHVDAGFVRSWRLLLDDAVGRGAGRRTAG